MHNDSSHEAIPLMTQGEYVHDSHQPFKLEEDQEELAPVRHRWSRSAVFLSLACFVTAFSLAFNSVTFVRSFRNNGVPEKLDISKLRRPSLYLGLERVPELLQHGSSSSSQAGPLSSPDVSGAGWPTRVARVNSAHPDSVFPQDGWVLLTERDHMIIEFATTPARAGQRCAIQAYFPGRRDLRDKLLTIERDDGVASEPVIHFTALSFSPVDLTNLTWSTRPSAVRLIDLPLTLNAAAFGSNQTTVLFPCPSHTPLRVEAMCAGGGCRLEYDASGSLVDVEPLLGIRLVPV
ncbi:uncharacterized protein PHACADRAFT_253874 [Phanerochaete carnosa HHB-10118-sp]|uniref:Ubiquitin 3 binding protein But2 C-terminal domain-containing protein n=1 Tax=Phanerochaete carnosa (strain HHB-10118-sp) TaxID=650164 RepID=K5V291_PHACS|nr:uncharacterized protein PHACADRAFT_253874 [Phanerochaete carnosa HHB-10118-sp]EKM56646.1 hypothetical protein PHACADRAFT_253874 [Phanerochaete carnosa HHB-10118-sp]